MTTITTVSPGNTILAAHHNEISTLLTTDSTENDATITLHGLLSKADKQKLTSQGVTGSAVTFDASAGADYELTTNGNVSITIASLVVGQWLSVTIDYTGAHTVTWTTTINWQGGTTPTATSANGKTDIFVLKRNHAGTKIYGVANLNFTT
jgi:hypothetical protein